jgi:uncharacterized protein YjbI with pentapeptide repeats
MAFEGREMAMNKQDGMQATSLQRPTNDNKEAWKAYWEAQGQTWRTEPEIEANRQKYFDERRSITPDIEKGIYPFKDIKLSRADIEWLLATHENGRGPIDWNDESQRQRKGLDLRGADLQQENLRGLPLARMCGGLTWEEWHKVTEEQRSIAAMLLQGANLLDAQLQEAKLTGAQLQGASLLNAQLQEADLSLARLQKANLERAQLQEAKLTRAQLQEASLLNAQLQGARLTEAHLQKVDLRGAHLQKAKLTRAHLQGARLSWARLQGANLTEARLQKADLSRLNLQEAELRGAQLQRANLTEARLQGADMRNTDLKDATLEQAILSDEEHGSVSLADVNWGGVNLTVVDWSKIKMLGDEYKTRRLIDGNGNAKPMNTLINEYQSAIRANRQLAVALRDQGINEEADWFAYRAQVLKRRLLWKQIHLPWILQGQEKLGWKEQIKEIFIDGKKITRQMLLRRIPRRQSILPLVVLTLLLFILLPWCLPTGVLLFETLKLLVRKVPKIKRSKLTPRCLWLKNLFLLLKQDLLAFLTLLTFLFFLFISAWIAFSLWQSINSSTANHFWGFLLFCILLFLPGLMYAWLVTNFQVSFQVWWLKRKSDQHIPLRKEMHKLAKSEEMSTLFIDWGLVWITILYDDLVCYGQYFFSLFLDLLSGYGYKPVRTLFWYLTVVFGFATAYSTFGHLSILPDGFVFSLTSFHGRGFFPGPNITLSDPRVVLAAFEAVIGLVIEISFIATFTQRYFGK